MKKSLLCLALSLSMILSAAVLPVSARDSAFAAEDEFVPEPADDGVQDAEDTVTETDISALAAETETAVLSAAHSPAALPDEKALPLWVIQPAEDAKSAKIERTNFAFSDSVSVRRYTGSDATGTIPENNVYSLSSSAPELYTDTYRYCEVVYYYDTVSATAQLKHFGFTLGCTKDLATGNKTAWSGKTIYADDTLAVGKWTSAVFDLSELETLSPNSFGDSTVYEHIRLRPFGDMRASALADDDVLYIKSVRFLKEDPSAEKPYHTVRYYENAVKAVSGGDDYLFADRWTVGRYETVREYERADGTAVSRWCSPSDNTVYKAGERLYCDLDGDVAVYPAAQENYVYYVCTDGVLSGVDASRIHTSLQSALYALGDHDGTIYVSGQADFPRTIDSASSSVTIRGYSGTDDRINMGSGGSLVLRDVKIENITLKAQAADERWIEAFSHITIGESCVVEKSAEYQVSGKPTSTGLYFGRNDDYERDGKLTLSSPSGVYTMIAPIGQYSSGASYSIPGNFECILNDGTYGTVNGGVRNGCSTAATYQTVGGDVTYRVNGGNIGSLITGNTIGGHINGNVLFCIDGGTYKSSSQILFGNTVNGYAAKSSYHNIAVVIDGKSLSEKAENSNLLTVKSQSDFASVSKDSAVLILNHAEYSDVLPSVTASGLTGKYRVYNGEAVPVYADAKYGGALLGYEIRSDVKGYEPRIGEQYLLRNEKGVYTLPAGDTFYDITFGNALAGKYFAAYFDYNDGSGEMVSLSAEGNVPFALPSCSGAKDGCVFGGWEKDGVIYRVGEPVSIGEESVFRAVWQSTDDVSAIFVHSEYGSDASSGICYGAPVATVEKALERAAQYGVSHIVFTNLVSSSVSNISFGTPLVFTANDGVTQYDGGFINLSPLGLKSPITFGNMAMGSKTNSFVNTLSSGVVFGKGLTKAAGTNGVYAHFGSEYAAPPRVCVTAESFPFASSYLGGAYLEKERVGVNGDITFTVGCNIPTLKVGFDGYTGRNASGSIAGSLVLYFDNGSIGKIETIRLSSIGGAVYAIVKDETAVPDASLFPESEYGTYILRVRSGGTVTPAVDSDGKANPGMIHAVGDAENSMVRVTDSVGVEAVYPSGDIALSPGSYAVEFFESEKIISPSFDTEIPYIGFRAAEENYSASAYTAKSAWYCDGKTEEYFKADTDYELKITLTPRAYADASELTDMVINGKTVKALQNADGSYTATLSYPKNTGTLKTNYVRYVSENGSDNAAGTEAAPYQTLKKALTVLSSVGGTIYIRGKVNAGGTYVNRKPVYITGYGDKTAELILNQYSGITLSADTTFDDLTFTCGAASHFNGKGSRLIFGENLTLDAKILHAGAYNSGKSYRTVEQSRTVIGGSTTIATLHAGGGYITNPADGVSDDISIEIGQNAVVRTMSVGADHYQGSHTGVSLDGSLLVTVNGGTLNTVSASTCPLYPSEKTTYQFIFNYGSSFPNSFAETAAPLDRRYTVFSSQGGRVDHALDENGRAVPGYFDVNPDPDHYALIQYGTYSAFSSGGRFAFPKGTDVKVSYIRSEYPLEHFMLHLNGGSAVYDMISIDENGLAHFGGAPEKQNAAFEGWYRDEACTALVKEGDYIGSDCVLFAKYYTLSRNVVDRDFDVMGVQMRLPLEEGTTQALRYVLEIDLNALSDILGFSEKNAEYNTQNGSVGYGATVLPTEKLAGRTLLCDTDYVYRGKNYRSKTAKALKLYGREGDIQRYTLCVTGITEDKYEYSYTVRPYLCYYSRSGNLVTVYGDAYSTNTYQAAVAALESGSESEEANTYMRTQICQKIADKNGFEFIPRDVLEEVNAKTAQYKQNVLNSRNLSTSGYSKVYYVAANGSDSNSGTSPSSPWKTVAKVNSASISSNSLVLFRRGDTFRGKITAKAGVTYSAYGSGAKPIINGSNKNYADPSLWVETGIENVYKLTEELSNVGIIAFNHSGEIGKYDELVGEMRVSGVVYYDKMFYNQNQLDGDLQFYSNLSSNELFLYSADGNPGSRFDSIEIGYQGNLFSPASNVTVDNLHFLYGGSHGVGGGGGYARYDANGNYLGITGTMNLTVTNCIFAWIGGSVLRGFDGGDTTRYGNAVEMYSSVDGYHVENNWIYQIYDTAITHQMSGSSCGDSMMKDILYRRNLCEYCHWSIEFYNAPCKNNHSRITRDVLVEENIIRMGGYGWGSIFRRTGATLYNSFGLSNVPEETQNFLAKNNIFFRSMGPIFRLNSNASERNLTFDGNLYIQDYGKRLAYYCGTVYSYQNDAEELISAEYENSIIKETNCGGVYYYLP